MVLRSFCACGSDSSHPLILFKSYGRIIAGMKTRRTSLPSLTRTIALLLAVTCLWISGGAVLHHSDDDWIAFRTFAIGKSVLSHAAAATPAAPCAACQWEQTTQTPPAPSLTIQHTVLARFVFSVSLAPFLHLLSFTHTAPRAPPRVAA